MRAPLLTSRGAGSGRLRVTDATGWHNSSELTQSGAR
eukprot:gene42884-54477_t